MIRKLTCCLLFGLTATANAQDLRIPNTPAFSILDYEPAAVMRPTSAKKLSSDILNSFDADGKLITNIGIEVTPYWLKNRPLLSRKNYLNPTVWQTIKQTFTLSAATVKDTITDQNHLGAGLRFEIIKGNLNDKVAAMEKEILLLESIKALVMAANTNPGASGNTANINTTIAVLDGMLKAMNNPAIPAQRIAEVKERADDLALDNYQTVDDFCKKLAETYDAEMRSATVSLRETINKRTGFSLEAAAASKFVTTGSSALEKAGFWLNANYYMSDKDGWTITARLMANTRDTTSVHTDVGLSYIRMEKDFNISVEGMCRWFRTEIPDLNQDNLPITRLEKDFTYRLAAQVSYTVISDVSVNLSIGKEFEDPRLNATGLFSIMGISYAIFNRREKNPAP